MALHDRVEVAAASSRILLYAPESAAKVDDGVECAIEDEVAHYEEAARSAPDTNIARGVTDGERTGGEREAEEGAVTRGRERA